MVSMEHLQRVWYASKESLPLRTPGSVPFLGHAYVPIVETSFAWKTGTNIYSYSILLINILQYYKVYANDNLWMGPLCTVSQPILHQNYTHVLLLFQRYSLRVWLAKQWLQTPLNIFSQLSVHTSGYQRSIKC